MISREQDFDFHYRSKVSCRESVPITLDQGGLVAGTTSFLSLYRGKTDIPNMM
jgi:hypothetical protein